jgi:hypothetical protein
VQGLINPNAPPRQMQSECRQERMICKIVSLESELE